MTTTSPVTVVVPTYNEQGCIADCIDTILAQDHHDLRLLIVDGGSEDRTRQIVTERSGRDPRVELLDNPRRTAAAAMNVGLAATRTELLVRADAHAVYAPDYVSTSLRLMAETGADDIGGPMVPVGTTRFGRAVAAVTSSKIGMGSGAFHWTDQPRDVDTVYLGCYRTEQLRALGGWDEAGLQYAAEDQELNFRIRLGGGRIVCDPAIRSWYFPRDTARHLWRQYQNYGLCKASTLAKHRRLPSLRPLAPAGLVAVGGLGLAAAVGTRRWLPLLPLAVWLGAVGASAARMGREPGVDPSRAAAALAICHVGHGVGFWRGLGRIATGHGWDTRPQGHR